MNQNLFLHIVERLESFLGKLPETIQKPVLRELTPLKELFLQQRAPRLLIVGPSKLPLQDLLGVLSGGIAERYESVLLEIFRWQELELGNNGNLHVLDARSADEAGLQKVRGELSSRPADLVLFWEEGGAKFVRKKELENLATFLKANGETPHDVKVLAVLTGETAASGGNGHHPPSNFDEHISKLRQALEGSLAPERLSAVTVAPLAGKDDVDLTRYRSFREQLLEALPNETRVEMIRVSRDREGQIQIAQSLVKSTSAICAAIGAQPIPLADLPVLTTLQLVMVAGVMQLSGRERSMRAATEFVTALGVNVGAGMLLREGARAMLKFFPGWGNVVCGMVAGAGTYGIGRAAIAYFIEGLNIKEARRTYLASKKKPPRAALPARPPSRR